MTNVLPELGEKSYGKKEVRMASMASWGKVFKYN